MGKHWVTDERVCTAELSVFDAQSKFAMQQRLNRHAIAARGPGSRPSYILL